MFVIQVEIENQLPVVEEIDEQVQDAANIGFQEGLLPEEEMAKEQWCLKDVAMAVFNTIFHGYKTINTGFMDLSKLIDATPLHTMGQILNDIQESAARLAGYGRGEGQDQGEGIAEDEGEVEEVIEKVGRGRKKGREGIRVGKGLKEKRTVQAKFQKGNLHLIKRDTTNIQKDSTLQVSPGPLHDLTPDDKTTKARSKEGKRRVKKVGLGDSQTSVPDLFQGGKVLFLPLPPL